MKKYLSGINHNGFAWESQFFLQEEGSTRHSDLYAEMQVISLDLFGCLILTEMSLVEPGLC